MASIASTANSLFAKNRRAASGHFGLPPIASLLYTPSLSAGMNEAEWLTRRNRIDTKLRSLNPSWQIVPWQDGLDVSCLSCHAVTEFPTANRPADYALFVNGSILGIHPRKKSRACALTRSDCHHRTYEAGK